MTTLVDATKVQTADAAKTQPDGWRKDPNRVIPLNTSYQLPKQLFNTIDVDGKPDPIYASKFYEGLEPTWFISK